MVTDNSGSDSVGGVSGANGTNGNAAADAAAEAARADAVNGVAQGLVDNATTAVGVDVNALAESLSGLQAAVSPEAAKDLQSAVESQLSAVEAAQLQSAMTNAALTNPAATPTLQSVTSPLAGLTTPAAPGLYSFNAQGQMIDACGNPVATVSVDRSVATFAETDYGRAVTNLGRAVGGPISGPAYTAAWASGASQPTLDTVHAFGKTLDGAFGVQSGRASKPSFQMSPPTPAGWNQTQR
jgi:hypothetical protein